MAIDICKTHDEFTKKIVNGTPRSFSLSYPVWNTGRSEATYSGLIKFTFEPPDGVGVNNDGTVTLGRTNHRASGELLKAVFAFGFEIAGKDTRCNAHIKVGDNDTTIPLRDISFLGVVSTTPVTMSVYYSPDNPDPSVRGFTLKNVLILPQNPDDLPPVAPNNLRVT